MLAVARGSHSCAAEIDLGTTTPRKKPGPENLGSGDETRELHKTRVFHQIFNAADGPEKSGFRACLTEIRPKPPSINPQNRKKSHNQNPGFARKTQVTHSPIPGLSRVSPRSRVFPGCLCCVLQGSRTKKSRRFWPKKAYYPRGPGVQSGKIDFSTISSANARPFSRTIPVRTPQSASRTEVSRPRPLCHGRAPLTAGRTRGAAQKRKAGK